MFLLSLLSQRMFETPTVPVEEQKGFYRDEKPQLLFKDTIRVVRTKKYI